ncbi:SDR family NAD(P)-dependent oxidoreductase [Litorilinea aerophila]|uniref:SDR family NAD(P)-dependent oxidoreductase n=1 Tax=Litorilinea aerophila TaxID=1204385 RepID=A0A540VMF6_9CHLR|nr:SDR family NAD(P)-dependent oxidoreductase [Litorilinea aerophila]MCC9074626.1 SDR family NAD(P)-dependent oxidoreductase [Litorilinea aerophila]OUC07355.1 hypothetical protein RY27_15425 [Litorilinea aerophila]
MAKIFITGSADGLGQLAAQALVAQGHEVVLHARNPDRVQDALGRTPGAVGAIPGDLSSVEEIKHVAEAANRWGTFDAVIHNAGIYRSPSREVFVVNALAPYLLTCLIQRPKRLIYLSSDMHLQGRANLEELARDQSRVSYSDSKLYVTMLCMAVARKWRDVYTNAVDPGWVPTRMGGPGAPDDLQKGYETQVWLAVSDDPAAKVSGKYFYHQQERAYNPQAGDVPLQERFLDICETLTGVPLPA